MAKVKNGTRAKPDPFHYVPAYGASRRAPAEVATPTVPLDATPPVSPDDVLPSTTPCPRCGQEQLITSLPLACSACGTHLLGAPPPTFDARLVDQIATLDAAITTLDAAITTLQHDEDQLRRTLSRTREQLALLQQYHALTTEEP